MSDTPPTSRGLLGRLLPNGRLIGGAVVAAAAVGIYLGTKFQGWGVGDGGGGGIGTAPPGDVVVSTEGNNGKRPPRSKSGSSGSAPAALDVIIDGDGYQLRQGPGKKDVADATLAEILRLLKDSPPDNDCVRMRIFRRSSALPTAEIRIQDALQEAGVAGSQIHHVKELLD